MAGSPTSVGQLDQLIRTTTSLAYALRALDDHIHQDSDWTSAERSVLRDLADGGPQTVPTIARKRPVARQHIQALVNSLKKGGLVELRYNPAHKRSKLVALTDDGWQVVEKLQQREKAVYDQLTTLFSPKELAAGTVRMNELRRVVLRYLRENG